MDEIRRTVAGRWLEVFNHLAPELRPALEKLGRHVACPVHGGRHGDAFRLFKDAAKTGGGICNTCGAHFDGWAILMWLKGWSFLDAVEEVGRVLGLEPEDYMHRRPQMPRHNGAAAGGPQNAEQIRARIMSILADTVPITNKSAKPLWRYWLARGIPAGRVGLAIDNHKRVLRFHPSLPYYQQSADGRPVLFGFFPALIGVVSDVNGNGVTIHRIYIAPDGSGKAKVPGGAKKLYPVPGDATLSGAAIHLGSPSVSMGVAEGIETALSVTLATGEPVWSVLNASLLAQWTPPKKVSHVTIWADRDRSRVGEEYARRLRTRLQKMGISVRVMIPGGPIPPDMSGIDWNDVWRSYGADGFNQGWWRRLLRKTG